MRASRKELEENAVHALAMRMNGLTNREIGIMLARNMGRNVPYQADYVRRLINRAERSSDPKPAQD